MNKLIKIEDEPTVGDYYIVVSDSEIKEACYVYKHDENVYGRGIFYLPDDANFTAFNEEKSISKVTHSTVPMIYTEQGSLDELIEICKNRTTMTQKEEHEISDEAKERAKNYMALKGALEIKEETLEEAAEKYAESNQYDLANYDEGGYQGIDVKSFAEKLVDFTTNWQAEKMYSEEDMISFAKFFTQYTFIDNTSVGDLYALDETGNHPAYKIAELISIFKKK
jgi:hypothetical protein